MCVTNSQIVAEHAERFAHGHWSFLGRGSEKKRYGTHTYKRNGRWNRVAKDTMLNFSDSGHAVFRGSSASRHFCGDDKTVEVVLRTIISINQLSIYGAVADMCDELTCRISGCLERTGKLVAQDNLETTVIPTELRTTNKSPLTDDNVQENMLQNYVQNFANLPEHLHLIKLCSNVGITKTVARRQYFTTLDDAALDRLRGSCRE